MTGEGRFFTKVQFYKSLVNGRHYSYDQIPDSKGKVTLVTGASQGPGYATTLALVAHGTHVVMACRTEAKVIEAIEKLHKDVAETYPHSVAATQIVKGERLKLVPRVGFEQLEKDTEVGPRIPVSRIFPSYFDQQ